MKKLIILFSICLSTHFCFGQTTNLPPTTQLPQTTEQHSVESDIIQLFKDLFPSFPKEDYALLCISIHFAAKYYRNYKIKDISNPSSIQRAIAHLAISPLPPSVASQPTPPPTPTANQKT